MVGQSSGNYLESPLLLMSGSQNMPCHIDHWLGGVAVAVVGKVVVVAVALTFEIEASGDDDRYRM